MEMIIFTIKLEITKLIINSSDLSYLTKWNAWRLVGFPFPCQFHFIPLFGCINAIVKYANEHLLFDSVDEVNRTSFSVLPCISAGQRYATNRNCTTDTRFKMRWSFISKCFTDTLHHFICTSQVCRIQVETFCPLTHTQTYKLPLATAILSVCETIFYHLVILSF